LTDEPLFFCFSLLCYNCVILHGILCITMSTGEFYFLFLFFFGIKSIMKRIDQLLTLF
jgi:hypothetical protein